MELPYIGLRPCVSAVRGTTEDDDGVAENEGDDGVRNGAGLIEEITTAVLCNAVT